MPKKKTRKPTDITFIFETDYTDKRNKKVCGHARYRVLKVMTEIMKLIGLDEYDLIICDKRSYYKKLQEKNIPELWIHEASNHKLTPLADYYVVNFEDGSSQMFALIPPSYEEEHGDPMFR